jgi:hypothetical protein
LNILIKRPFDETLAQSDFLHKTFYPEFNGAALVSVALPLCWGYPAIACLRRSRSTKNHQPQAFGYGIYMSHRRLSTY